MSATTTSTLPPTVAAHLPTGVLVAGRWRPAHGGGTFAVADPGTEEVLADVADGTEEDALEALGAADAAADAWRRTAPRVRSDLLRAVFDEMVAHADDLAAIVTAEGGKPLAESRAEVLYAAEYVRWYSEEAVRAEGLARRAPAGTHHQLVLRRPVGPALLVTPWNFPIAMIARKLAPALAAGCPVVVKPAQLTPLTTAYVADIVRAELEARDLPAGVVNVVPTSSARRVSGPLLADPRLRKLSFTGSTEVGRTLLKASADGVLRTSMELGGNAPFLVFDDADLDAAVQGAVAAKMRNAGQTCVAANRFLVQAGVAEEFTARLTEAFGRLVVGHGADDGVTVGPLIEAAAVDHVDELVTRAADGGAVIRTGGERVGRRGYFYAPTVLADVAPDQRVVTEEIFGPVAPVVTFGSEAEGVALANGTEYGLVAYAYTGDMGRAMRLAEDLETGMLGLNRGMVSDASAPFGGVKSSGLGREGGEAGIEEYLETVYVAL
ncbi:NAD-dependent succinate-semialdehyde dehydrogenase [Cellulomonas marina]|uniref:Succinate-semialdehyde dehydrogenase / glutarate-semialdehyde dehydrogenase n=1 Tax=Cellulomonas marina TaxID=988821 RepID=A0A1I0VI17_9CELL|nr:NAD-dependent succinate-semialdehyde dehydrogenase [Cellulomonas marina]GIG27960.1 NAD-dependent succinate-semialdehyde dehydrogenase [Cellulomonas marina]SFA75848.1 succinate-semialdehyde dehydrogenase / glutarate-semialdehyde dehydrogenase [Cellulomonas marina]